MKNLNAKEFEESISKDKQAVIIDVRTPQEEVEGKIENAICLNIMNPSFIEKVKSLDKTKHYYVYCRSGGRSATACEFMESLGLTATNLAGGILAWNQMKSV